MQKIPGLKFEKDSKGNNRYVRIDLKQHKEALIPFLIQLGALDKAQAAKDEEFWNDYNRGMTLQQLRKSLHHHIDSLPWKK